MTCRNDLLVKAVDYLSNTGTGVEGNRISDVERFLSNPTRRWAAIVGAAVCADLVVSLAQPRGFVLTAVGDIVQSLAVFGAVIATLSNLRKTSSKVRWFWLLLGTGLAMWCVSQLMWTYVEVYQHHEVPNPFVGDVILFLHIVPMMAAIAVQPHVDQEDSRIRVGTLDFALLLTWWLFLYLFVVIPWQYVYPSESIYGRSFDLLYLSEKLALATGLMIVWRRSRGAWRTLYFNMFVATLIYCVSSLVAGEAIDLHLYYTGSLFDLPILGVMFWFIRIGCLPREIMNERTNEELPKPVPDIWKARLAMAAVIITPLMMGWAQFGGSAPQSVRNYRLLLTAGVMLVMGGLVFVRQHLLDQELLSLLRLSRQNLEEMCRLKDELESKERSLRWHSLELQRKNVELQEISFTDVLTGVWNRRYLEEILPAEAGQVLRNYQRARGSEIKKLDHRDLVFIMVDMDFFKDVNDRYGHPAGDRLLQLVAQRLGTVVRKSDVLARWGGEEFLIMSRSADPSGVPAFCSRILEVMSSAPFDLGQSVVVSKTCSVGWASYPWSRGAFEALCAEESIALADAALYRAKEFGRNQGVGIIPTANADKNPEAINLFSVRERDSRLARTIRTKSPARQAPGETFEESKESADRTIL